MFRHTQDKLKKNDGVAGERSHPASPYSAENVHSKSPIRGRVKACAMCVCVCVCVCVCTGVCVVCGPTLRVSVYNNISRNPAQLPSSG